MLSNGGVWDIGACLLFFHLFFQINVINILTIVFIEKFSSTGLFSFFCFLFVYIQNEEITLLSFICFRKSYQQRGFASLDLKDIWTDTYNFKGEYCFSDLYFLGWKSPWLSCYLLMICWHHQEQTKRYFSENPLNGN